MGKLLGHPKNAASAQIRRLPRGHRQRVPQQHPRRSGHHDRASCGLKWHQRPRPSREHPQLAADDSPPHVVREHFGRNLHTDRHLHELGGRGHDARANDRRRPMGLFALSIYEQNVPVALTGWRTSSSRRRSCCPAARARIGRRLLQKKNDDTMLEDSLAVGAVVAPKSPVIDQPVATLRGRTSACTSCQCSAATCSWSRGDPRVHAREGRRVALHRPRRGSIGEVCVEHGLLPLTHEVEETLAKKKRRRATVSTVPRAGDARIVRVVGLPGGFSPERRFRARGGARLLQHRRYRRGRSRARRAVEARRVCGARKPRKTHDYKDVLHAFQMDQDVPGGYSRRGDDSDAGGATARTPGRSERRRIGLGRGDKSRKRRRSFNLLGRHFPQTQKQKREVRRRERGLRRTGGLPS